MNLVHTDVSDELHRTQKTQKIDIHVTPDNNRDSAMADEFPIHMWIVIKSPWMQMSLHDQYIILMTIHLMQTVALSKSVFYLYMPAVEQQMNGESTHMCAPKYNQ